MTNTIKIKNSGTASNSPSSLEHGELAINYADGKIFYKDGGGSISEFGISDHGDLAGLGDDDHTQYPRLTASTSPPSSPRSNDLWFHTSRGRLYTYYDSFWVEGATGYLEVFSPLSLSPALWLDASDTSTITESSGSVSQWDDKSGNGLSVTQATGVRQPTTGTRTLNGLNVLDFDGSSMSGSSLYSLSATATYFLVIDIDTLPGTFGLEFFMDGEGSSNRHAFGVVNNAGNLDYRLDQGSAYDAGDSSAAADSPRVFRVTFDTTDTIHQDSVSVYSAGAGTHTSTGITIGSQYDVTRFVDCGFAEIIAVDGTLTSDQINDTETYLADKWGITLS